MKNRIFFLPLITAVFILFPFSAVADIPEEFTVMMERAGLEFTFPEGYMATEIIDNPHMHYEYALVHPTEKFEIRYAVRPMDELLENYREFLADPPEGSFMQDPNAFFPATAVAVAFNTATEMPQFTNFDAGAVRDEFNADSGSTSAYVPREAFSGGYYMFDNIQTFFVNGPPVFYNLKFK